MANLCAVALLSGLLARVLRALQWLAYDPQTELFTGSPLLLFPLLAWLALTAAVAFLLCRKLTPPQGQQLFYCPKTGYMVLMTISAFLFWGAGLLGLYTGFQTLNLWRIDPTRVMFTQPVSLLLCALLCFPSGLAVLLMGKEGYRGTQQPKSPVLSLLPPLTGVIWLFSTHMEHSTDPVLLRYGFLMAAIIFLTLATYDAAGFFQNHPHPLRFPVCSVFGIVLAFASLADRGSSLFQMCLIPAFMLLVLSQLYAYLTPVHSIPTDSHMEAE